MSYERNSPNNGTKRTFCSIRVQQKSYVVAGGATSTPAVTYEYDRGTGFGIGQLDRVATAGVSTMAYGQYDALGRMGQSAESVLGNSYLFGYRYNLAGSLISETYPSGRTVTMQYDAANRATQVADSTVYVAGIQYAAQGGFQSYVYGNGLRRFYAYNQRMQPAEMTDVPAAGGCAASTPGPTNQTAWALDLQLFWGDGAGQVSTNNGDLQSELIQTCNGPGYAVANNYYEGYLYDPLNRLFAVKEENGADQRDFRYDNWGNVWVTGNSGTLPALSASTPTSNIYSGNQRTDTTYDAAGNETSVAGVCAAGCLQYDAESRQTGYTPTGTSYSYDGDGRRVISTANGVSTVFVYDAMGSLSAKYTSGVGGAAPCTICYLSWDHLGSTRMVTDQSGNLVARHDYLAFGEEIRNGQAGRPSNGVWGGLDSVNQKFTGKERDSESGLDWFGARYYGATLGRFTSPDDGSDQDPANPQSWNLYSYVRNNPLTNVDPTGQDCVYAGNYSSTGTVGLQTGDCTQSGGVYVNGTIDTSSLAYNPNTSQLGFSYANGDTIGSGTIGNVQGPAQDSDNINPFGAAVVRSLGARTDASYQLMGAFAAGSLVGGGAVAGGLELAGSGVADGIISQASQYLSKSAARAVAQRLASTPAQAAAAASAISRATANSSVKVFQDGTRLVVQIVRLGRDGYQEVESVIDQAGGKDVVQKAVNNAGDLVHYDPK